MDTATQPSAVPAFNSDDVNHVAEYRSLSVMAIISLLIGLASPLCLLAPMFFLLPLCGLVVSLLALRRIAVSDGRLAGRWAATVGLALCVACGVAAMTRTSVTQSLRSAMAEEFSRKWLTMLLAKESEPAFKLTFNGARPPAPPEPGMPTPATTPYEDFMDNALVQSLLAAGQNAKIEYVKTEDYTAQSQSDYFVRQRYRITPQAESAKSGSTDAIEANLTLQRSHFRGDRNSRWLVATFAAPGETAN